MAARSNAYVAIHDSRIVFNRASSPVGSGGGLAFSDNSKGNLTQLLLSNNSAGTTGGGLALLGDAKVCVAAQGIYASVACDLKCWKHSSQ